MKNKIEKNQEFVTKNSFTIESMPLADAVDVSRFIDGPEMFLVSYSKETTISGDKKENISFKKQVIINHKTLEKITLEPNRFEELIEKNKSSNPIYLVTKDYWEFFREEQIYNRFVNNLEKEEKKSFNNFEIKKCFDNAKNNKNMFVQYVENKNHQRVIMNANGELAAEGFVFDYIGAQLDNGNYDLDKVVEHLMKRDDVAFVTRSDSYSTRNMKILKCPLSGNEPDVKDIIADIPGYNAEEGRDETICLVYYPKAEDIGHIIHWEMSETDKKNGVYNLENFIVQEVLECKQFRKNPVVPEETETPKRKFKR